jgi:hypothetical protein
MKLKKITFETAVDLNESHTDLYREAYIKGYNRAVSDLKRIKKAKRDKTSQHEPCPMSELIGEANNRISKIGSRLSHTETYCIDNEIKKIHAVVQAHDNIQEEYNSRMKQLEHFNCIQITMNNVNQKYLKNYDFRLQQLEKPSGISELERVVSETNYNTIYDKHK